MHDLPLLILLVCLALGFVSLLLYMTMRARFMSSARIWQVLAELWGAFGLVIAVFAYLSRILGPAPVGSIKTEPLGRVSGELALRLAQWQHLLIWQQIAFVGGILLALALFAHLIWTLRSVQSGALPHERQGGHQ